jgi:hypothetical protein
MRPSPAIARAAAMAIGSACRSSITEADSRAARSRQPGQRVLLSGRSPRSRGVRRRHHASGWSGRTRRQGSEDQRRLGERHTLRIMAEATDGVAVVDTNAFVPALRRMTNDLSASFYLRALLDREARRTLPRDHRPGPRAPACSPGAPRLSGRDDAGPAVRGASAASVSAAAETRGRDSGPGPLGVRHASRRSTSGRSGPTAAPPRGWAPTEYQGGLAAAGPEAGMPTCC